MSDANETLPEVTMDSLKAMAIDEILSVYNAKAEKPVAGFKNKATAVSRTFTLYNQSDEPEVVDGKKVKKPKKEVTPRSAAVLNCDPAEASLINAPREGSKRLKLLEFMQGGPRTIEEIREVFGWTKANTMEALRFLGPGKHGYGFATDKESGKITISGKPA